MAAKKKPRLRVDVTAKLPASIAETARVVVEPQGVTLLESGVMVLTPKQAAGMAQQLVGAFHQLAYRPLLVGPHPDVMRHGWLLVIEPSLFDPVEELARSQLLRGLGEG